MQIAIRHIFCTALAAWLCGLPLAAAEPGFRRFADSISPDGAYVFAWGWGGDESDAEKVREWPAGADSAEDGASNYLVETARGRVVAMVPEGEHYETSDGKFPRFSGLCVAWSEDSRHALAIYEGRWRDNSILWIDPQARTFTELLPQLQSAAAHVFAKHEKMAGLDEDGVLGFSMPALLPGGVLVIDTHARQKANDPSAANYRLKFQVKSAGGVVKCTLLAARKVPEAPDDEKVEQQLNRAYQQLRAKLDDAGRAALKTRQLAWLAQRAALPESDRAFFTRLRAAYLRARTD